MTQNGPHALGVPGALVSKANSCCLRGKIFGGNFVLPERQPGRVALHPTPTSPAARLLLCLTWASVPLPGTWALAVPSVWTTSFPNILQVSRSPLRCHLLCTVFLDLHPCPQPLKITKHKQACSLPSPPDFSQHCSLATSSRPAGVSVPWAARAQHGPGGLGATCICQFWRRQVQPQGASQSHVW